MLNIEKYKDIVLEDFDICHLESMLRNYYGEKVVDCANIHCGECEECLFKWLLEESKEKILDDVEKDYLSAVIRPFREKVKHIAIWDTCEGSKHFVHIKLYDEDCINLPNFKPNAMYKGMELHKEYTLEELGL